jgi:peptidyl-prolyl cis-trans isomerase SurA
MENTPKMMQEVQQQVTRSLIVEALQLQAAQMQKVFVSEAEITTALENMAKDNGMTLEQMKVMFKEKGVGIKTLMNRVRAQIAWVNTMREAVAPFIHVSDQEVATAKQIMEENNGKTQFELLEIVLRIDNLSKAHIVKGEADKIYEQLKQGAPFLMMARQFSESMSSENGGHIGWFAPGQMDPAIETAVSKLKPGDFTPPIRIGMSYVIIYLQDIKPPNQAPIGQTQISYKRVMIPYSDDATEEARAVIEMQVEDMRDTTNGNALEAKANEYGYVCETDTSTLSNLPAPLKNLFHNTPVNQCTMPINTGEHIILHMVSTKKPAVMTTPTNTEIRAKLENDRISKAAVRELNRLETMIHVHDRTRSAATMAG